MTRFSRVTFNAAHKYLGLTTEVLRTEKAINDIACHPLPASFYASGGLNSLRQRFDEAPGSDGGDRQEDVFAVPPSSATTIHASSSRSSSTMLSESKNRSKSPSSMRPTIRTYASSRKMVQAGDLLSMTGHPSETYRPRAFTIFGTPRSARREPSLAESEILFEAVDDFDLREEVMSCIAKSIGLIQPPMVGDESLEASPPFPASDSGSLYRSSFGSLSLLDMVNDNASSVTGSSSAATEYMSGLDNEVEIRFFPAGSTLASAGERNTGTCTGNVA
jgi:lysophospholipid hydrolase